MTIKPTLIQGLYELQPDLKSDERGNFFKTFHQDAFEAYGLPTHWAEDYFSTSNKNVIRGMHFQTPPMHHHKIVTCLSGSVLDVVVDIRKDSYSFKKVYSTELNSKKKMALIIPKGCAHGFLSLEDQSLMFYKVSTVYCPEHDKGILWDSIGFDWPESNPKFSKRDGEHPHLDNFESPF